MCKAEERKRKAEEETKEEEKKRYRSEPTFNQETISYLADELYRNLKAKDSGPTKTPASRGREAINSLRRLELIYPADLNQKLPPIIAPDELAQLQKDFEAI